MDKIAYRNEHFEKGRIEDFYSQIEKFDSNLAEAFKTFFDENGNRIIFADFIPEKENEDLRAARLLLVFIVTSMQKEKK